MYREGNDVRANNRGLLQALSSRIGPGASDLPDPETTTGVTSRIAKIYASDMPTMNYARNQVSLDFRRNMVGMILEREDAEGKWVLEKTADVIARALVLPCLLALDGEEDPKKDYFGDDEVPSPVMCFALNWRLNKE